MLDVLNGVPAIVVGIFVFGLLVVGHGQSAVYGAFALAILMLPMVARATQEVLEIVPRSLREASLALGVTKWRTTWNIILPGAIGGILTGVVIAVARVAGETAPLLFTRRSPPTRSRSTCTHALPTLPVTIFIFSESPDPERAGGGLGGRPRPHRLRARDEHAREGLRRPKAHGNSAVADPASGRAGSGMKRAGAARGLERGIARCRQAIARRASERMRVKSIFIVSISVFRGRSRQPLSEYIDKRRSIWKDRQPSMKKLPILESGLPIACCTPLDAPSLTDDEAAAAAAMFKALADPARIRIVNMLATAGEGVCVCDLTPHLGLSQPTVSHHLRELAEVGLLEREQRGTLGLLLTGPRGPRAVAGPDDVRRSGADTTTRMTAGRRWAMAIGPLCCDDGCDCGDDCC